MNILYRLTVAIMAILVMFASMVLLLYAFGLADHDVLPALFSQIHQSWEYAIVFVLLILASAWIIYPIFSGEERVTPISKSKIGEVDISLNALDTLVNNIALEQEGITAIKNRLKTIDGNLSIELTAQIFPSKNIPEITGNLQKLVKSYIEDITGVTVGEIKILVETVASTDTNDG
ncbi:alkaline shock response membrane anchor protein AmaP [Natronospora cellulosivora (SeqCode)]